MKQNKQINKWIAGMALASTASAHGALVQINLVNNFITLGGGNSLDADLTGDGIGDVTFTGSNVVDFGTTFDVLVTINGYGNRVIGSSSYIYLGQDTAGGFTSTSTSNTAPFSISLTNQIPITFDATSLGGSATQSAFLEVTVTGGFSTPGVGDGASGVTLNALFFDDGGAPGPTTVIGTTEDGVFTPVPEPSSLALLALGAGGILLRRNRKQAA